MRVEIEEFMEITNYRDFFLLHYPNNIADIVKVEKEITEFDTCIYFKDVTLPTAERISDLSIALQYFEAVYKCRVIPVSKDSQEEKLYLELRRIVEGKI